ncbi:uncharacterized protein F4817DRAFT_362748 [Daldinia loculata]|uniref:uncharacterized protein n=1 Tax=Daldinia loculata TaxID=103429 RepID=UPI0020C22ADC|nr:uncharacterized protein F4817DRAFT_362748 [Daldinia loculata]KAI1641846.1 hypothetical protein F4817DRAFT_362748 [Daldinia loculata]
MDSYDIEGAAGDGDLNDFSCYITINNLSDEDLGLSDFGINGRYGVWPEGMPLNTIDAHTSPQIQLKDPKIYGGSEGWVEYQVLTGGSPPTFRLEFACPELPWSSNYLKAIPSKPDVYDLKVLPYKESGHPFYGQVDVKITASKSNGKLHHKLLLGGTQSDSFKAEYDIGFDGAAPLVTKKPVHETIGIAAFILSNKLPKGTTYHNLNDKQWEYFRGAVWNDDPSCYLFDDYTKKNHEFSTGLRWYEDFEYGPPSCMIQRSHFGDLQFLHGMGATVGEMPAETQRKILKWLTVMYKLACGNQGVSDTDQLQQALGEWFDSSTTPTGQSSLRDLILANTPNYYQTNIQWRALGICLHMITDSYAVGHTQRRLRNPESYLGRDEDGYMVFKPGTWGDWGAVINFHCYAGQNSDQHAHYDGLEDAPLPVPKNLDSFNSIIGARNAIEGCRKLIDFWADGTKWEDGVETFLHTEIFAIDQAASPSNSQVDQSGPISLSCCRFTSRNTHVEYQAGLRRKLNSVDSRVLTSRNIVGKMRRRPAWKATALTLSVLVFAIILTLLSLWVFKPLKINGQVV